MNPETRIQIDFVKWLREKYPKLLFTSTQAGNRMSKLQAILMKRMGYTNGTPDLLVLHAIHGWYGLMLELKTEKGVWSAEQREFCHRATILGYKYAVAYGLEQAKEIVREYLGETYTWGVQDDYKIATERL